MTFRNEFIPPLEQETSVFLKFAREAFGTGFTNHDRWTVDREGNMALHHAGSGREMESAKSDLWSFIDQSGRYVFGTELLSKTTSPPQSVTIKYRLKGFWQGENYASPTPATISSIKNALREYCRWHMFDPDGFASCHLTLIDGHTSIEV